MLALVDNKKGMVPKNYIGLVGSQPDIINSNEVELSRDQIGTGGFADVYKGTFNGIVI